MDFSEDIKVIKDSRLASNISISNKDVEGVSKWWLADFIQIAGDGSYTAGKTKIVAEWKKMFKNSSPVFERLPKEIQISDSGDKAWEQGFWYYKNDEFRGNYSAMWRKVRGRWLIQSELYVSLN